MKFRLLSLCVLLLFNASAYSADSEILRTALKKEMTRTLDKLSEQKLPPYFISFFTTETQITSMRASFGKIRANQTETNRLLDVDLRVGNYKFDNTHIIRGNPLSFSSSVSKISLPIEDDEIAIRSTVWYAADKVYKAAIERYEKAQTNQAVKVTEEDTSDDFSKEKPVVDIKQWKKLAIGSTPNSADGNVLYVDTAKWAGIVRRLSSKFNKHSWLLDGSIYFTFEIDNKLIQNTEGTEVMFGESFARLFVMLKAKAEDGMSLPLHQSYFAFLPDELPSEDEIGKKIDEMIETLNKLRLAPLAETYSGPAILSGEAAGVFFHEIFGHRVEGHREKDPSSSQTFKQSVGKPILPDFINVIFDPTINRLKGYPISGYYKYDDEGVPSRKVETVKNGIFADFLMSRIPIDKHPNSNGHGRKQVGYAAVSRQSNLIVEATNSISYKELRNKLIEEAKKQNKEYGLFFDKVSGGFTFTSRNIPNAFNVTPIIVYKVFVDGRPDELVRGVDLIGTPLTTFSHVTYAADDLGIFNGVCGAESGGVPVSASSPSLLVSKIEVQKKAKSQAKLPILEAPQDEAVSQ